MFEYFEAEKAVKKSMTAAEKKELKKAKDELEAPYTHCTLDGRKEKVGNFRVEPPGLFRGRGEHPKKGSLKVCSHIMFSDLHSPSPPETDWSRRYHNQYCRQLPGPDPERSWEMEGRNPRQDRYVARHLGGKCQRQP